MSRWLGEHGVTDSAAVTHRSWSREFAAERASAQPPVAASSLARLQSSVRGLHRFLAREGIEPADPSTRLRPPKLAQRLPKALTIDQVERAAGRVPTRETPQRLRDRALLELLYATGARVSEVGAARRRRRRSRRGAAAARQGRRRSGSCRSARYARAAIDAYLDAGASRALAAGQGDARAVPRRARARRCRARAPGS